LLSGIRAGAAVTLATLRAVDERPFSAAVGAGVKHVTRPAQPCVMRSRSGAHLALRSAQ
jgi:hypothetical protein